LSMDDQEVGLDMNYDEVDQIVNMWLTNQIVSKKIHSFQQQGVVHQTKFLHYSSS
jgi:hypothetical protein